MSSKRRAAAAAVVSRAAPPSKKARRRKVAAGCERDDVPCKADKDIAALLAVLASVIVLPNQLMLLVAEYTEADPTFHRLRMDAATVNGKPDEEATLIQNALKYGVRVKSEEGMTPFQKALKCAVDGKPDE